MYQLPPTILSGVMFTNAVVGASVTTVIDAAVPNNRHRLIWVHFALRQAERGRVRIQIDDSASTYWIGIVTSEAPADGQVWPFPGIQLGINVPLRFVTVATNANVAVQYSVAYYTDPST